MNDYPPSETRVLVTGASGYVATHVINVLLKAGYMVRGTVRSLSNKKKVEPLYNICPEQRNNLELVEADLTDEQGWLPACTGCQYVMHVASPFPSLVPNDENEVILPAVKGTLFVLEAALKAGVKKVVVTSSVAAVGMKRTDKTLDETDWTDPKEGCSAYVKSKFYAEQAVWHFFEKYKDKIEITCINPGLVVGPTFMSDMVFTSSEFPVKLMTGQIFAIPDLSFGAVDVREVADAHFQAMIRPETNGKRYIVNAGTYHVHQMASTLAEEFTRFGYSLPTRRAPICLIRFASIFDPPIRSILNFLGKHITYDNERSRKELGIEYRSLEKSFVEMVYSLIKHKYIPSLPKSA